MPGPSSHSFHQQVQQASGTVLKAQPFFSWDKKSWGRRIIPNGLGEGCKGKVPLLAWDLRTLQRRCLCCLKTHAVHEKHGGYMRFHQIILYHIIIYYIVLLYYVNLYCIISSYYIIWYHISHHMYIRYVFFFVYSYGIYLYRSHLHLPAILALAHSHVHSIQMSW